MVSHVINMVMGVVTLESNYFLLKLISKLIEVTPHSSQSIRFPFDLYDISGCEGD